MKPALTPARLRAAWIVAIAVDALQLGLFPLTGGLSTWLDKPLDLAAMLVMWWLLGWSWAFLPTFVVELVPFVELVPTWTAAVWIVSRLRRKELQESP
ncbi:MAG TPA: hypothetical protein VJ623_13975 [Holophagaceae bacterium]|nr:hypothetical protein [Holophagaceae bacterium]